MRLNRQNNVLLNLLILIYFIYLKNVQIHTVLNHVLKSESAFFLFCFVILRHILWSNMKGVIQLLVPLHAGFGFVVVHAQSLTCSETETF